MWYRLLAVGIGLGCVVAPVGGGGEPLALDPAITGNAPLFDRLPGGAIVVPPRPLSPWERAAHGMATALVLAAAAGIGMARGASDPLPGSALVARCGAALVRGGPLYVVTAVAVIVSRLAGEPMRAAAGLLAGGAGAAAFAWPGALAAGIPLLAASGERPGLEIAVPAIFTLGWGASQRRLGARTAALALLLAGVAVAATASLPASAAAAHLPRETSPASAASNGITRGLSGPDRAIMGFAPWHRRTGNPACHRHRKEDAPWCS